MGICNSTGSLSAGTPLKFRSSVGCSTQSYCCVYVNVRSLPSPYPRVVLSLGLAWADAAALMLATTARIIAGRKIDNLITSSTGGGNRSARCTEAARNRIGEEGLSPSSLPDEIDRRVKTTSRVQSVVQLRAEGETAPGAGLNSSTSRN